jgi:hypothetical protein
MHKRPMAVWLEPLKHLGEAMIQAGWVSANHLRLTLEAIGITVGHRDERRPYRCGERRAK